MPLSIPPPGPGSTALVGMEIGPTGAQFGNCDSNDVRHVARFDGRQIVRHAVAAHGDYLVLWVRDAWHETVKKAEDALMCRDDETLP